MSLKVAVLGEPCLAESVIQKFRQTNPISIGCIGKLRTYNLIEYQYVDASQLPSLCSVEATTPAWFIHCHYAPLTEIPTPVERSTVYVASKVLSLEGCYVDYVTSVSGILPRMIASITDGPLYPLIEEARFELASHALWCFGMMIILTTFTGAEHSDDPFAITLDVLLLIAMIWYLCDMIGSLLRIIRGQLLESPSLQRNNGLLQRSFVILYRRRGTIQPQEMQEFTIL
jgi:hypothetical protein